ncbi:GntR family transcriptional regulator [Granulosicoccus sp. 3-233]|uniref:GntR family transcriptional regulator n=1 Tax=Granulosicoccus sp. 3-233 TaxID=3417969 RepID=UPI003D327FC6
MNTSDTDLKQVRRTTADELFDQLRIDIEKLRLRPGTKLSEANVAQQYSVSRQPVREALIRLDNLELVQIRPQKATIVRRMSKSTIRQARFVRLSVELEVARRACARYDGALDEAFQENLDRQSACLDSGVFKDFNRLDREFHALLCEAADCMDAIEIIDQCKAKVDRLCMLSLTDPGSARSVLDDHHQILSNLLKRDTEQLCRQTEKHLQRLDATIDYVQQNHEDYFDA